MNELRKQMRELSLEMFNIQKEIDDVENSKLPEKNKMYAIEELNDRLKEITDKFNEIEISYNTAEYQSNVERKTKEYEELRAQRAEEVAEFNRKRDLVNRFANQNLSASMALRNGSSIDDVYNKYKGEIDAFERNSNIEQQPVYEQPVVGNENVVEPIVGVPETVIPEPVNEEASALETQVEPVQPVNSETTEINVTPDVIKDLQEATESNDLGLDLSFQEAAREAAAPVEPVQPVSSETTEINVTPDIIKDLQGATESNDLGLDSSFQEAAREATTESENIVNNVSNPSAGVQDNGVREDAPEEHKSLVEEASKKFKGFLDMNPEGRKKVKSIAIAGAVIVGAVTATAALVSAGVLAPILAGAANVAVGGLSISAVNNFNKGRKS